MVEGVAEPLVVLGLRRGTVGMVVAMVVAVVLVIRIAEWWLRVAVARSSATPFVPQILVLVRVHALVRGDVLAHQPRVVQAHPTRKGHVRP